jgi:hypothetical protein
MQTVVLLRQSNLSNEYKKKVLAMTGGLIEKKVVENAMRILSTKVLFGTGEVKKKIYHTNCVEHDEAPSHAEDESNVNSTYVTMAEEDDALTAEVTDQLSQQGDEDALLVQQFGKDLEDLMQDVPDFQTALISY